MMFFVSVGGRPVHVLVAWQQLLNHVVGFPTVDGLYESRVIKRTRDILKNTSDHPMREFYSVAKLGCRYEQSDIAILSYPLASGCSMRDWGGEVNGERGKWMGRGGSERGEGEVNGERGKWTGRGGSERGEGEVNGERGGSEWGEGEVNGERGKWMGRGGCEWGEGGVNGERGEWMGRGGSEWGEGGVNGERGEWMGRGGSEWGEGGVNGERGKWMGRGDTAGRRIYELCGICDYNDYYHNSHCYVKKLMLLC